MNASHQGWVPLEGDVTELVVTECSHHTVDNLDVRHSCRAVVVDIVRVYYFVVDAGSISVTHKFGSLACAMRIKQCSVQHFR